jgi:hypothetical protein
MLLPKSETRLRLPARTPKHALCKPLATANVGKIYRWFSEPRKKPSFDFRVSRAFCSDHHQRESRPRWAPACRSALHATPRLPVRDDCVALKNDVCCYCALCGHANFAPDLLHLPIEAVVVLMVRATARLAEQGIDIEDGHRQDVEIWLEAGRLFQGREPPGGVEDAKRCAPALKHSNEDPLPRGDALRWLHPPGQWAPRGIDLLKECTSRSHRLLLSGGGDALRWLHPPGQWAQRGIDLLKECTSRSRRLLFIRVLRHKNRYRVSRRAQCCTRTADRCDRARRRGRSSRHRVRRHHGAARLPRARRAAAARAADGGARPG